MQYGQMGRLRLVTAAILTGIGLLALGAPAEASHFRYGHVTWKPTGTPNEIEFTVTTAWRLSAFGVGLGGTFNPGSFSFGDGTGTSLLSTATAIDTVEDWVVGQATLRRTYAAPGDYQARFTSCCRISTCSGVSAHINNPDDDWDLGTTVNVGSGNSSPVSSLPPIVQCPIGGVCSFAIPSSDNDGDTVTARLATPSEAGFSTQPGPPHCGAAASVSAGGIFTWDTTGCTLADDICGGSATDTFYSTQVILEDGETGAPLDFLIQLVSCPVANSAPQFVQPPTPMCGSTLSANPGQAVNFTVEIEDPDDGGFLELNVASLPVGAAMVPPLPLTATTAAAVTSHGGAGSLHSHFSWVPNPADIGQTVITFTARDQCGAQQLCSITVDVSEEICTNGIDDDGDGDVDCADFDCAGESACFTPTPTATPTSTSPPTESPTPSSPADLCGVGVPAPGACKRMVAPRRARLRIWDYQSDSRDRVEWEWRVGEATAQSDFGNPTGTTDYAFCIYDGNGVSIFSAGVPAGDDWRAISGGFKYVNRSLSHDGVRMIRLRSKNAGERAARLSLTGQGDAMNLGNASGTANFPDLGAMPLPVSPGPVVAVLVNSAGNCWESHFRDHVTVNKTTARRGVFTALND